jgi:hypothetical protein
MVPESKRIRIQRFGHSSIEMPFMAGASGKGAVRQNGDLTQTRRPFETMLDRLPSRPLYPVDAEVVWFNESKCFGSVKLLDGAESYLHTRALEAAGSSSPGSAGRRSSMPNGFIVGVERGRADLLPTAYAW